MALEPSERLEKFGIMVELALSLCLEYKIIKSIVDFNLKITFVDYSCELVFWVLIKIASARGFLVYPQYRVL